MKYLFSFLFLLALSTACRQKVLSGKELEDKLKEMMTEHLHNTLQPGTTFTIKDMTYYADKMKKAYICSFTVEMHTPVKDTTGIMMALIPNDFSKVTRTQ